MEAFASKVSLRWESLLGDIPGLRLRSIISSVSAVCPSLDHPKLTLRPSVDLINDLEKHRNSLVITNPVDDRAKLGQRVQGTCEWISKDEAFQSWLHGDSRILWVSGSPGKGKTMISHLYNT